MFVNIKILPVHAVANGYKPSRTNEIEISPNHLTQEQKDELATCSINDHRRPIIDDMVMVNGVEVRDTLNWPVVGSTKDKINTVKLLLNARIELRKRYEEKIHQEKEQQNVINQNYINTAKARSVSDFIVFDTSKNEFYVALPNLEYCKLPDSLDIAWASEALSEKIHTAQKVIEKNAMEIIENEAAAQRERKTQIDGWVKTHGTDNHKARHKNGLLDENEVLDNMRDKAFKPFICQNRFVRIADDDVKHACSGDNITYTTDESDIYNKKEFDSYTVIKTIAEGTEFQFELRRLNHIASCRTCTSSLTRKSVLVRLKVGVIWFSREYTLN